MLKTGKKSHLNSGTFSRFSRPSRLKANALFSLTSKPLASSRLSLSLLYRSVRSNVFILSSIAVNLCFIFCCSKNKMAMQDIRKITTATYRTHRRISEKRPFSLFLSWSMMCRWNFDREEVWTFRKLYSKNACFSYIEQPIWKVFSKWCLLRLTSDIKRDNIVSDYSQMSEWSLGTDGS